MDGLASAPLKWRFDRCVFEESTLELSVDGVLVELERKPMEVLRHLLRHAGEVVTKEEIHAAVWPGAGRMMIVDGNGVILLALAGGFVLAGGSGDEQCRISPDLSPFTLFEVSIVNQLKRGRLQMTMFKNFLRDESGASAAEYAIIIAIIGAALVIAMGTLGTALKDNAVTSGAIISP